MKAKSSPFPGTRRPRYRFTETAVLGGKDLL